jgi:ribosomal protein L11 methyltransferase
MCVEAIERVMRPGARVLDVGCGSGILSLAAAKLGAAAVYSVDVDDVCVRVTEENARANGVEAITRAARGSLGESWPFEDSPAGRFDVVVANIIARTIVELAPALVDALAPSGRLIVSGVIQEREDDVRAALELAGGRIESVRAMGDWRCIEAAVDAPRRVHS